MAFESAKKVGSAPKATGKAKAARPTVELANVEQLAQLHVIKKAAEGAIKAIEGVMKEDVMQNVFLKSIEDTGTKPTSVDAVEGVASMNIQFRKRSTLSPFKVEELRAMALGAGCKVTDEDEPEALAAAMKTKGFVVHKNIKTEKLFVIDPQFATDATLMAKVEAVLKKAGLDHVIGVQDEVATYVVNDDLMDAVCKNRNPELITPCATIGFKPSLSVVDPKAIAKTMGELLDIELSVGGDEKKFEEKVTAQATTKAKATRKTAKATA